MYCALTNWELALGLFESLCPTHCWLEQGETADSGWVNPLLYSQLGTGIETIVGRLTILVSK